MSTEQHWHETGETELRLRVTLDSVSEGVILCSSDGRAAMFTTTARAVIAEHCSDATAVDFLRRERIDFAQGYHVGRPNRCTRCCAATSPHLTGAVRRPGGRAPRSGS